MLIKSRFDLQLCTLAFLVVSGAGLVYADMEDEQQAVTTLNAIADPQTHRVVDSHEHPNMDSRLVQIYNSSTASTSALSTNAASTGGDTDRIRVVLVMMSPDAEIPAGLGIKVETSYEELVQVTVPVNNLGKVAADENVMLVKMPSVPVSHQLGETVSEGTGLMSSIAANHAGYTGDGIKVAVIDTGFDLNNPEIAGNIKEYRFFSSDSDITADDPDYNQHGTGSAEIVVDVAPNAELYLYTFDTEVELFNLIDYIIGRGDIDIITMSLGWYNDMGQTDGKSRLAQKVNEARASGILWVTAAGNEAFDQHWQGQFSDPDGDGWHNFSGDDNTLDIWPLVADVPVKFILSWWDSPSQNYDLHLYQGDILGDNLTWVASSTNIQPAFEPYEVIEYTTTDDQFLYLLISGQYATQAVDFQLFGTQPDLYEYAVPSSSLSIPADATGAMAVGASHWRTGELEDYSSRGPTIDGRIKPDIMGPTCVSTTAYGLVGTTSGVVYCGTSAATPHVAGAAALVMEKHPTWTASEVQQWLEDNTRNHHAKSNTHGTGLVDVYTLTVPTSSGLESRLTVLETTINTSISSIESRLTTLENAQQTSTAPSGGNQDLTVLENKVTSLETKTTVLENMISTIQTTLNRINTSITGILDRLTSLESGTPGPTPTPPPGPTPPPEPTPIIGIEGKVYNDSNNNNTLDAGESGIPNRTVLVINLTNTSDVNRLTTDSNGDYSIELAAGSGWLVQVEGTNIYSYVTVQSGSPTVTNLGL